MYVEYKYGDKTFFKFSVVRYSQWCILCKNITTRKLMKKGVLAKELLGAIQKNNNTSYWAPKFICSEKCIKEAMFKYSLKGNIKLRQKVEDWLSSPPQEYFISFRNNKTLIRVITKQTPYDNKKGDETNFVEFYDNSLSTPKGIQFFASTKWLKETFSGIINLLDRPETTVEEKQ